MFPNWQQYFNDPANRREGPATAREAAKDAIRNFVELNWSVDHYPFQIRAPEGWDAHICSRKAGPNEDQPQELKPGQIAITRLQDCPCLAIFELAELIAEIRREASQEEEADMDSAPGKSQQDRDHGSREEQDEAREAVKALVRALLDDGIPEEEVAAMNGPASTGNWRFQINGSIIDQGEPCSLHRQIAAIGPGYLYWSIFDVAEIVDELRREEPKVAAESAAPTIQEEEAQRCWYCGSALEIKAGAGRDRHFCENNGKCRVAYHRQLQRQQQREAILQNTTLADFWQQHHITGPLLTLLQEILIKEGRDVAQAATDAIIGYASEQAQEKDEEIAQLEHTIMILKHQLDLEYRFLLDTQARGLISFLQKEPPSSLTPLTEKILAHAQELPPMASHSRYASYLRRKQLLSSEEELAEFKELWKRLMVEAAQDKYADF